MSLRNIINTGLRLWKQPKQDRYVQRNEVYSFFKNQSLTPIGGILNELGYPEFKVDSGVGTQRWAAVSWIRISSPYASSSAQEGVYLVYLFSEKHDAVYLTINQGTEDEGMRDLRKNAEYLRGIIERPQKFEIGLGNDVLDYTYRTKKYTAATIYSKKYNLESLPLENELQSNLADALKVYNDWLSRMTPQRETRLNVNEETKIEEHASRYTIDDFMNETGFSREVIETWNIILRRKKQIVFQGPPGTGKTFVAERLAKTLVSETSGFWEVVQFHSAYSYEDFIQGFKPDVQNDKITFPLKPGIFKNFCEKAKHVIDSPCILIIDEINRANLARVFGELMFLLEYRDKEIPLAAGGENFRIPENVHLIGTMNTADRSIALVDHALRRRFSFIRLKPEYGILGNYLERFDLPASALIDTLKEINQAIDDQNYEVGISYFMKDSTHLKDLLPLIWVSEIEPYLEEYFYDQPGKVTPFRWENLAQNNMRSWIEPT